MLNEGAIWQRRTKFKLINILILCSLFNHVYPETTITSETVSVEETTPVATTRSETVTETQDEATTETVTNSTQAVVQNTGTTGNAETTQDATTGPSSKDYDSHFFILAIVKV